MHQPRTAVVVIKKRTRFSWSEALDEGVNVARRYMQVRFIDRRCQQVLRESVCDQASGVCVKALEFSTQLADGNFRRKHFDCNQAT